MSFNGEDFAVAALVQANHGTRDWLTVCAVQVGQEMQEHRLLEVERGSIIVILATDAPLGPLTLRHMARRANPAILTASPVMSLLRHANLSNGLGNVHALPLKHFNLP